MTSLVVLKKCYYNDIIFFLQDHTIGKCGIAASIRSSRGLEQDTPLVLCCRRCYCPPRQRNNDDNIYISWRGVHPILANDGVDHHKMASNRYEAHLAVVHGIGTADLTLADMPVLELELERKWLKGIIL